MPGPAFTFSSPVVSRAPRVLLLLPALHECLYHRERMGAWAPLCVASGWLRVPPAVLWAPGEQGLSAELTGRAPQQWKGSGWPGSWDGAPGVPRPHCELLWRWTSILGAAQEARAGRQGLPGWGGGGAAQRRTGAGGLVCSGLS